MVSLYLKESLFKQWFFKLTLQKVMISFRHERKKINKCVFFAYPYITKIIHKQKLKSFQKSKVISSSKWKKNSNGFLLRRPKGKRSCDTKFYTSKERNATRTFERNIQFRPTLLWLAPLMKNKVRRKISCPPSFSQ